MTAPIDLSKLKQAAEKATKGKWTATKMYVNGQSYTQVFSSKTRKALFPELPNQSTFVEHEDCTFIAMANPDTVKRLIQIIQLQGEALKNIGAEPDAKTILEPSVYLFREHAREALATVRRILEGEK